MVEITLKLPETIIRKIRAYNILLGGSPKDFETTLMQLVEQGVTAGILNAVVSGVSRTPATVNPAEEPSRSKTPQVEEEPLFRDASQISEGLGDDDIAQMDDPYLSEAPQTAAANKPGITDDALEGDMDVDDPSHEAKMEATFADQIAESPEAAFAQIADLPTPPIDHRVTKRGFAKTTGGRRARVRPMLAED